MNTLRRNLFHYEAPEDGGGEVAAEPVEDLDLGSVDLDAVDTSQTATAQEAEAWALSQEDWQQTLAYLQQTAPILQAVAEVLPSLQQQQQQQPQQNQIPDEIDPFDPSSVTNYIQRSIETGLQQALQQHLAPYEPMLNSVASEQGAALARQELESIKSTVGEFDQDTAFLIAAGAIEQGNDPATALRQAAQFAHDFEQKIRADERDRFKSELRNLQQAPDATPVGDSAATEVQPVPTGPRRYHEVVDRYLSRQNSTPMVG